MRTKTLRTVLAAAVLGGSAVTIGYLSTGSASAEVVPETLPASARHSIPAFTSLKDVVVDPVRRHVAVSDGSGGRLAVLNYDGTTAVERTGLTGVNGLKFASDYGRLYAAVPGANAVIAYDAATLAEVKRYPVGTGVLPEKLAFAGDRLWFSYQGPSVPTIGGLGSLDLTDGTVTTRQIDGLQWAPLLASSPAKPDLLALAADNESSGKVEVYNVAFDTTNPISYRFFEVTGLRDIGFSPDGSLFFASGWGGTQFATVSEAKPAGTITNPGSVQTVGVSPAGLMIAGLPGGSTSELNFVAAGDTTTTKRWKIVPAPYSTNKVAWEPGGGKLFTFVGDSGGGESMWVLDDPAHTATALKVSAPATAARGAQVIVAGTLSGGLPAGTKLSVTRTDEESPQGSALTAVATDEDGAFTVVDQPPAGGTVKYTIAYAGDGTFRSATATASLTVTKTASVVTLSPSGTVYNYGTTVGFTAHLGAAFANRTVEIWADPYGSDQANRLLRKVAADAGGNVTTSLRLTRNTTVSAVYAGDSRYAARTVRSTVYTRVGVTTAVTKQYATSGGYYVFHKTKNPVFTTTMTAAAKRKQKLSFEVYSGGKWKPWKSYMLTLSSAGKSTYTLTGTHTINAKYRVRAAYVTTTSGDNLNYTTYGPYRYFTFRK
ncbi:YncE family protein [Paractinoplanes durhamensis]|uniref:Ig-like domain repeat protein n=1 Tax=Paractinoplanes durhamensis TaxID=113563 RepID=A0ABQ3Z8E2_9ACTN|nr:hypothetical protein [Actinoplanes durhamensis]GIE05789.1 hypothetical protein Adu01nite_71390 [Actinoplanes durhamensis]